MINPSLTLSQICSIYNTDKNILHSYIDYAYEDLLKRVRDSTQKVLEIGVDSGASLFMWRDYFQNAKIYGIDTKVCPVVMNRKRINFIQDNAYTYEVVDKLPNDFDIIIDDGPHTLESMVFLIKEYLKKINDNGMVIIEDIQDFHWTNILRTHIPDNYSIEIKDLRKIRDRYDDILMIIKPTMA